jgi:hypothetical protein
VEIEIATAEGVAAEIEAGRNTEQDQNMEILSSGIAPPMTS